MEGSDNFYHFCTNGLSRGVMFRDDREFVAGMNDIPSCALSSGVKVYCFCLMDNHVHFILKGSYEAGVGFARQYKRLRSRVAAHRDGGSGVFDDAGISMKLIDDPEYLLTAIAYVLRNPVASGMAVTPGEYPWSSGALYFGDRVFRYPDLRRMSEMSGRQVRELLGSRVKYPDDYLLQSDGMIFPGSYVEYRSVEKMFGSPKRFLYYLSRNQDIEVEMDTGVVAKTRYRDGELAASLEVLSREMFSGGGYMSLRIEDRIRLAKELRRRYGANIRQVTRVTGLDAEVLRAMGI